MFRAANPAAASDNFRSLQLYRMGGAPQDIAAAGVRLREAVGATSVAAALGVRCFSTAFETANGREYFSSVETRELRREPAICGRWVCVELANRRKKTSTSPRTVARGSERFSQLLQKFVGFARFFGGN